MSRAGGDGRSGGVGTRKGHTVRRALGGTAPEKHAVVYGVPAIACAIGLRARVRARQIDQSIVRIRSSSLGLECSCGLDKFEGPEELRPSWLIASKLARDGGGLDIEDESEIPASSGLGSSAAVSVATAAACSKAVGLELSPEEISSAAFEAEKVVHGTPSGIDNAVSTHGGVVIYEKGKVRRLSTSVDFRLVIGHTGIDRNTGVMVDRVRRRRQRKFKVVNAILDAVAAVVEEAERCLLVGDLDCLGELMDINHGLLDALGVNNLALHRLVCAARSAGAVGAKLTGAGGGGCMVALCRQRDVEAVCREISREGGRPFPTQISMEGVSFGEG